MRNNSDAVIIGGGIIGLAVAFYLAKEKFGRIVLLEKEPLLGMGATSKAAGGIRAQFATKDNIKMSMLSEKLFNSFKEDTGAEVKFDKVGYLFILKTDNDVKTYKNNYELQLSLGLNVELLNPEGIRKIAPHISLEGVQLATYCPDDGLGDPHEFLSGYEHAARHLGVEIEFETEVTGIDLNSDKITAVKTTKGAINTPLVINCTGPFAKEIGKMIGVDIKVEPVRRQIVTTGELDFVQPTFPMVVDVQSGLYCHKESKGLLLGWADKSIRPSYDISVDPEYTDSILEKALNFIPQLAD
ncbi:MAG: NAD(P)/FAD-dependent oxidoreductase, partial [Candidatus Zixiibacteriota bacterium]